MIGFLFAVVVFGQMFDPDVGVIFDGVAIQTVMVQIPLIAAVGPPGFFIRFGDPVALIQQELNIGLGGIEISGVIGQETNRVIIG